MKEINPTRPAVPWPPLISLNGRLASADVWEQEDFPLQTEGNLSAEIQKDQKTTMTNESPEGINPEKELALCFYGNGCGTAFVEL